MNKAGHRTRKAAKPSFDVEQSHNPLTLATTLSPWHDDAEPSDMGDAHRELGRAGLEVQSKHASRPRLDKENTSCRPHRLEPGAPVSCRKATTSGSNGQQGQRDKGTRRRRALLANRVIENRVPMKTTVRLPPGRGPPFPTAGSKTPYRRSKPSTLTPWSTTQHRDAEAIEHNPPRRHCSRSNPPPAKAPTFNNPHPTPKLPR